MQKYQVINILDFIKASGEDEAKHILSDFLCYKNSDIENFVRQNAIDFAKKKLSVTYLVVDDKSNILAIFSLAHKVLEVKNGTLSQTKYRKIQRFSKLNETSNSYSVSAFLVSQFGKNDAIQNNPITGTELMELTMKKLLRIQYTIGGNLVYLECEEKDKLLNFYTSTENNFSPFDERYSDTDNTKYIRLLRFF